MTSRFSTRCHPANSIRLDKGSQATIIRFDKFIQTNILRWMAFFIPPNEEYSLEGMCCKFALCSIPEIQDSQLMYTYRSIFKLQARGYGPTKAWASLCAAFCGLNPASTRGYIPQQLAATGNMVRSLCGGRQPP